MLVQNSEYTLIPFEKCSIQVLFVRRLLNIKARSQFFNNSLICAQPAIGNKFQSRATFCTVSHASLSVVRFPCNCEDIFSQLMFTGQVAMMNTVIVMLFMPFLIVCYCLP